MSWHPEPGRRAPATSRLAAVLFVLCLSLFLGACGYTLGSESPSIFSEGGNGTQLKTLKVKSVDNPTLFPWLPYMLRTEVRDEVAARRLASWVDSGRADYEISFKVDSYTYRTRVYDVNDVSQLYTADLSIEATVYKGDTNEILWRSGPVRYNDSYEKLMEKPAAEELIRNIARQLADRMRHAF